MLANDESCFEKAGERDAFVVAEALFALVGEGAGVDLIEQAGGGDVEVAPVEAGPLK